MHHVKILFTYITDLKIPWWWLWQQRCLYFSHRYWTGDTAHIAILFFHNRDKFGGKSAMFANTREKIEGMHAQIGLCLLCRTWCMCAGHCQHWRTVTVQLSVFIPFGLHGYEECWFPPIFLHGRKTKWAAVTRIGIGTEFCTDSPFYIYGSFSSLIYYLYLVWWRFKQNFPAHLLCMCASLADIAPVLHQLPLGVESLFLYVSSCVSFCNVCKLTFFLLFGIYAHCVITCLDCVYFLCFLVQSIFSQVFELEQADIENKGSHNGSR